MHNKEGHTNKQKRDSSGLHFTNTQHTPYTIVRVLISYIYSQTQSDITHDCYVDDFTKSGAEIATTKLSLLLLKHEPDKQHTYSEVLDPSLKILDLQQVATTWYDWHMCMQWFPNPPPRTRGPGDEAMERRWGRGEVWEDLL